MSADRELLELAARAADLSRPSDDDDIWFDAAAGHDVQWNSLDDEGDALRLAIKLQLNLTFESFSVKASRFLLPSALAEEQVTMGYSIEDATRRAITRAAAEIGKTMA